MESVLSVPLFLFVDVCVPGLSCPQLTSCCGKPTVFSCRWQRWETIKRLTIQPLDLRFCFYNFFIPHLFLCLSSPQDFYQRERHAKFHLLPDTLDLWAESMQQRLLGYQEQAVKLVNVSRRGNGLPHEWPHLCLRVKLKVQILNISFFFTFLLPCSLFSRSGKPGGHFQGPASWLPFSVDQQLWTETRGRAHTDGVWNQTEPGGASGQQWAGEGENIKDSLDTRTRLSRSWSTRPTTDIVFFFRRPMFNSWEHHSEETGCWLWWAERRRDRNNSTAPSAALIWNYRWAVCLAENFYLIFSRL